MPLLTVGLIVVSVLVFLVLVGLVLARLYRRASREVSLVRTGSGGKRIVLDGGILVIPLLHEVARVNMRTLRLEVSRRGESSLITKDRMRVDVGVEFYVSVRPDEEGIAKAAQTLGDKTFDVEGLRSMIEGKLVDGLRSVAAQMTMDDLHEQRSNFVQEVSNAVGVDLEKNGLMLESVALTALDQTPFESLDEKNAFNAVGMRRLAEVIAESRKQRAAIEAEADVEVRRSAMEAERTRLQIERDEEQARIERDRNVAEMRARQEAEIAAAQELAETERERARIKRERDIREADIAREEAIRTAEITQQEHIRAAEISQEQTLRAAEIAQERELALADQERQIAISRKSEEESRARASADAARAEAVKAAEAIETARALSEAGRNKEIAIIEAAREAERDATAIRIAAEAERQASEDRAAAHLAEARADADGITIRAEARKNDLLAEAEGRRALADAENALSGDVIRMRIEIERLQAMPKILAEVVRPAEKIDSIRIHHLGGLTGGGSGGAAPGGQGAAPVNQALDAILGMAVQLPAMRSLGREIGLDFDRGMTGLLDDTREADGKPAGDDAKPGDDGGTAGAETPSQAAPDPAAPPTRRRKTVAAPARKDGS